MLDWVVFPCERRSVAPAGRRRVGGQEYRVAVRLPCRFLERWGQNHRHPLGSETKAAFGLSQGQALILVLVLSLVLYAAIWVTVALLSVAGGGELGRTVSR